MQPDFISDHDAQQLAQNDPVELARIIASGALRDTSLTFAAERLGCAGDRALVLRTLLPLLDHEKAYVREGALYGLAPHSGADIRDCYERLASEDPSRAIRDLAAGYIEDLEGAP